MEVKTLDDEMREEVLNAMSLACYHRHRNATCVCSTVMENFKLRWRQLIEESSKLDSARAAAAPAKHVAIVTNNNQPGWTNIVETAPNVTLHVGTKLYDESALIGVGVALVEQRAAEIIDLESRLEHYRLALQEISAGRHGFNRPAGAIATAALRGEELPK